MSGSSTFFATLTGASRRNAQGWKANAKEWEDYAKGLENDVEALKRQLVAAEERILTANAKIAARDRLLEQATGLKDADAIYKAFGGKEAYEAAVQNEITLELKKQVLGR